MESITITDPNDRSFPLSRALFEDRRVVYHGSWSTYSSKLESEGFVRGALPFDSKHIAIISGANEAIADGSRLPASHGVLYPMENRRWDISLTPSFWGARAYATDAGGEIVRLAIKEAREVEHICNTPQDRVALTAHWEKGLREHPNHAPTMATVELLTDNDAIQRLCSEVKASREALESVTVGGCPVVYAIRVEPSWFGDEWARYMARWEHGSSNVELRCGYDRIPPDRIVAEVMYANGTDSLFQPFDCTTWEDVEALTRG